MMSATVIIVCALVLVMLLAGWVSTRMFVKRVEQKYPPLGQFFVTSGARLHYYEIGEPSRGQPTLVLLHGASANLRDFLPLMDQLGDRFHLVAVDRPGSGYSVNLQADWPTPADQREQIAQLLTHLGVRESFWVGHSFAGSLVMAALLDDKACVGGCLLVGAAYHWVGGTALSDRIARWPLVGRLLAATVIQPLGSLQFAAGIRRVFSPDSVTATYSDVVAPQLYLRPRHFLATGKDITGLNRFLFRQSTRYGQIEKPLLMIWGSEDPIVPKWNHFDRLEPLLPQVETRVFDGSGHMPHHVHVDKVATTLTHFVDRSSAFVQAADRLAG